MKKMTLLPQLTEKTRVILAILTIFTTSCIQMEEQNTISLSKRQATLSPIRLAILDDLSGSSNVNGIAHLEPENIKEAVKKLAGLDVSIEIGFGIITEDSKQPLDRLFIPDPLMRKPIEDSSDNIFEVLESTRIYKDNLKVYDRIIEERLNMVGKILNELLTTMDHLLNPEQKQFPKTDVVGALNRANSFLCEPELGDVSKKYCLINGDLLDNVGKRFNASQCLDINYLSINGMGGGGILDSLGIDYKRFESFNSAIQYIIDKHNHIIKQI